MGNYFCDSLLTTGANDGSIPDDAWQSIKTAMENVVMGAGDICWIRRRSGFWQPTANIAPTVDGTLKEPVQFVGWPRNIKTGTGNFKQGSNVIDSLSFIPKFEQHVGRYIKNDIDGRNYLATAIAHKINFRHKVGDFTEGLMLEGEDSGLEAKIHRIYEADTSAIKKSLLDNLIGHWSLDDGSGLVAKDNSIYSNDGALEGNTPTWVDGKSGKAVNLPGVNERINCGNNAPLDQIGNGSFWISFWMKSKDVVPLDWGHSFSKYFNVQNRIMLRSHGTTNRLNFVIEKNDIIVTSAFSVATTPFDTEWNHIVLVINRITDLALVYMNTVKDATEIDISSIPADASNAGAVLWGTYALDSLPFEGRQDEMRIYLGLPTQEKIDYLFNNPSGGGEGTLWTVTKARELIDRGNCEDLISPKIFGEFLIYSINATWARDNTQAYEGTYSYKFTKTVAYGTVARVELGDNANTDDMHGLITEKRYKLKMRVYIPSGGMLGSEININIYDYVTGWEFVTQNLVDTYDQWQLVEVTKTIRVGATGILLRIAVTGYAELNEYFNVDKIQFWQVFQPEEAMTDEDTGSADIDGDPLDDGLIIDRPYVGADETGAFTIAKDEDYDLAQVIDDSGWTIKKADYNGDMIDLPIVDFGESSWYLINQSSLYSIYRGIHFKNGVSRTLHISASTMMDFEGCLFSHSFDSLYMLIPNGYYGSIRVNRSIFVGSGLGGVQRGITASASLDIVVTNTAIYNCSYAGIQAKRLFLENVNIFHETTKGVYSIITHHNYVIGKDVLLGEPPVGGLPKGGVYLENYQKIKGAHKVWYLNGTMTKVDVVSGSGDPEKRPGGADSVIEVTANKSASYEAIAEWAQEIFCHEIWVDLTSKSYRYYIQCKDMVSASSQLWLEAEYIDQYDDVDKYKTMKVKSVQSCALRTGADDWTQYIEVTGIQPAVEGWVRLRAFISHYDADGMIYIDPKAEIN